MARADTETGKDTVIGDTSITDRIFADAEAAEAKGHGDAGSDSVQGAQGETAGADDNVVASTGGAETVTLHPDAASVSSPSAPAGPPPQTIVERRGPGFVPLVLGGVIAVGLGYGATVMGFLPAPGSSEQSEALNAAIAAQEETLAALQAQSEALSAVQAQVSDLAAADAPAVDLSPVTEQIDGLSNQVMQTSETISALADRVTALEERPLFTGDASADTAAAAEAVAQLEEQMRAQAEAAQAEMDALATAAEEATAAAAEAEAQAAEMAAAAEAEAQAAIAAAQAEAEAAAAEAASEAALEQIRTAFAQGGSFSDAVDTLSAVTDVPEGLSAPADTGVPTLSSLQESFGPAARAALPVALRETAGENPVDRIGAFLMGQVGGRAIEPREGDGPDAILSRVGAAIEQGDLTTALAEIEAFPEGARGELAGWIEDVETRANAVAALDAVTQSLSASN